MPINSPQKVELLAARSPPLRFMNLTNQGNTSPDSLPAICRSSFNIKIRCRFYQRNGKSLTDSKWHARQCAPRVFGIAKDSFEAFDSASLAVAARSTAWYVSDVADRSA
jgi:hypothetical protein